MKASLKFREDQRPLARAKIPISILGLPFLAGAAAGDQRELRLDLTTAFETGPSFRVSYRPNESSNPFTLAVKTGIGAFGSPIAAPMSMTTEFNLLASRGGTGSPGFSVLFKPRLGDFCFKKSASSPSLSTSKIVAVADHGVVGEEMITHPPSPDLLFANGIHSGGKVNGFAAESPAAWGNVGGLLSGIEVMARSVLPIRSFAAVRFQWGVRAPQELSSFSFNRIDVAKLPMLVMSKISIEHIPAAAKAKQLEDSSRSPALGEVEEACKSVRRELAATQAESEALRKSVEDLRDKINGGGAGKMLPVVGNKDKLGTEAGKGGQRAVALESTKRERRGEVKSTPDDVNEELKKALMSATAAGK